MAASTTPPQSLKAIQPYMKMAAEYDKRDRIIAYYARLHAMQQGIKIDSKSPDCRTFLFTLMDNLEEIKKALARDGEEAASNDMVAQAHIENAALKLFLLADTDDRAGVVNKMVVKRFYTANLLFAVLEQFAESIQPSEENMRQQKYAKWKATYIHKCMKTGETPIAGSSGAEFEEEFGTDSSYSQPSAGHSSSSQPPTTNDNLPYPNPSSSYGMPSGGPPPQFNDTPPTHHATPPYIPPQQQQHPPPQQTRPAAQPAPVAAANNLDYVDYTEASKLCKYAISAMQYEDTPTAIENLTKALAILQSK